MGGIEAILTENVMLPYFVAAAFCFGMAGLGSVIVGNEIFGRRGGFSVAFAAGSVVTAFSVCLVGYFSFRFSRVIFAFLVFAGLFLLCRRMFLERAEKKPRSGGKLYFFAAFVFTAAAVFYSGVCLILPFSWDECVYQLAVPARWAFDEAFRFYPDLPYSAFPLLPQYVDAMLFSFGGLIAAKTFAYVSAIMFALSVAAMFRSRTAGFLTASALLLSPLMAHVVTSGYAESFAALAVASMLLAVRGGETSGGEEKPFSFRTMILLGILSGGTASIKLTGFAYAGTFFLFVVLAERRRLTWSGLAAWFLTALAVAAAFYARPLIATGNVMYPYASAVTGLAPSTEVSNFHHALGSVKFGAGKSPFLFILSFFHLSIPSCQNVFDGSCGFFFFVLLCFAAYGCFAGKHEGRRDAVSGLIAFFVFYLVWFFVFPQARFLLPLLAFLFAAFDAIPDAEGKKTDFAAVVLLSASLVSCCLAPQYLDGMKNMWHRIVFSSKGTDAERMNLLYTGTGDSLLPLSVFMNQNPKERFLLLFEERTLYAVNRNCVIATPFFQDAYFTKPEKLTQKDVLSVVEEENVSFIYVGNTDRNPDLLKDYFVRSENLFDVLSALLKSGRLARECSFPDGSILLRVVRPSSSAPSIPAQ